jgi:hypothetical protein
MIPSNPKLAGPVKHSNPDCDTVILTCDRRLKWPAIFGLSGILVLLGSAWSPVLFLHCAFYGVPAIAVALYFLALRANVILSKNNGTLELKPLLPLFQTRRRTLRLNLSEIREFLVESEFDSGSGDSPFVWHLTAITVDGRSHRLTWHFDLKPMLLAGEEAARITGKPLRVERDALKSSTWNRWGYNFLG